MIDKRTADRLTEAANYLENSLGLEDRLVGSSLRFLVEAHTMSDTKWQDKMKRMAEAVKRLETPPS